jgi:ABC-type Fe3+/spermidine/putrescine transport system ATPase subunit
MLHIENIVKQFDNQPLLRGVSLEVTQGDIVCLLGASGCGKTTLLRIIAGLEAADSGKVFLNGVDLSPIPVHQRGFGLMFQDFALFPHMNVAQNVAFGLQQQGLGREEIRLRVEEALHLVGLQDFAGRGVTSLSGGEQQRVALARSLAPQPRLLMLDEPLGSLDAALRDRLAIDLREIIKAAGVTAIYVTHDQQEAFAIADKVVVMNAGQIEQIDHPDTLYLSPKTVYVAEFLGLHNIIPVDQLSETAEGYLAQTILGDFPVKQPTNYLLLHPAYIDLADQGTIPARLEKRIFRGGQVQLQLRHASGLSLTVFMPSSRPRIPENGGEVFLHVRAEGVLPLG